MKVHVMTVGYTSLVFSTFISEGADKAIAIYSNNRDPRTTEALKELEAIPGLKHIEREPIDDHTSFTGLVMKMIRIFDGIPDDATVYVHIGGGMRHMAAALLYATLFVNRKMTIVCASRLPEDGKTLFEHEVFPSISFNFKLRKAKSDILKHLQKSMRLVEIVAALKGKKEKDMPRVHRLLKVMEKEGLVEFNRNTKEYAKTMAGEFSVGHSSNEA